MYGNFVERDLNVGFYYMKNFKRNFGNRNVVS